jgi:hypothetical protein
LCSQKRRQAPRRGDKDEHDRRNEFLPYVAALLDDIASSAGDSSPAGNATKTSSRVTDDSSTPPRPADSVVLSDRAKQVLARAQTDKDVADRLAAFVQSRSNAGNKQHASQTSSDNSAPSSNKGPSFEELAGITQTSSTTVATVTTGSGIVAPNGTDTIGPDDGGIHPAHSFSNTLSFGDFYITAKGDSLTDNSDVEIYAENLHASAVRWGGYSGVSGVGDGGTGRPSEYTMISGRFSGNQETFIFAKNSAAVSSVAAQDANASAVQTTAAAESDIVTITVDFNTGRISATQAHSSAFATLAGVRRTA